MAINLLKSFLALLNLRPLGPRLKITIMNILSKLNGVKYSLRSPSAKLKYIACNSTKGDRARWSLVHDWGNQRPPPPPKKKKTLKSDSFHKKTSLRSKRFQSNHSFFFLFSSKLSRLTLAETLATQATRKRDFQHISWFFFYSWCIKALFFFLRRCCEYKKICFSFKDFRQQSPSSLSHERGRAVFSAGENNY